MELGRAQRLARAFPHLGEKCHEAGAAFAGEDRLRRGAVTTKRILGQIGAALGGKHRQALHHTHQPVGAAAGFRHEIAVLA